MIWFIVLGWILFYLLVGAVVIRLVNLALGDSCLPEEAPMLVTFWPLVLVSLVVYVLFIGLSWIATGR